MWQVFFTSSELQRHTGRVLQRQKDTFLLGRLWRSRSKATELDSSVCLCCRCFYCHILYIQYMQYIYTYIYIYIHIICPVSLPWLCFRVLCTACWVCTVLPLRPMRGTGTVLGRCGPLWCAVACRPPWPWRTRPSVDCSTTSRTAFIANTTPSGSISQWATGSWKVFARPSSLDLVLIAPLCCLLPPGVRVMCRGSQSYHAVYKSQALFRGSVHGGA